jgi:hypothetical protein
MILDFLFFRFTFAVFFADAQAFDLFDTDGSGEIDSKELKVRGVDGLMGYLPGYWTWIQWRHGSSDLVWIAMVT